MTHDNTITQSSFLYDLGEFFFMIGTSLLGTSPSGTSPLGTS